jgi:hypothetical protein
MTGRLLLQNITQQIHQLNNRQGELTQPIVAQFGSLHLHLQWQLDSMNRTIRRLQTHSSLVAMNPNASKRRAMTEGVEGIVVQDERAVLTHKPKSFTSSIARV